MAQERNALLKDEEVLDLASFRWDDQRLSDLLSGINSISTDQAMDISRSLKEEIRKREIQTITIPLLEKIIEDKLRDYGISKTDPVRLDSSLFVRKG
jgi:ribonucleoside-diphosphate reductase alpha chain